MFAVTPRLTIGDPYVTAKDSVRASPKLRRLVVLAAQALDRGCSALGDIATIPQRNAIRPRKKGRSGQRDGCGGLAEYGLGGTARGDGDHNGGLVDPSHLAAEFYEGPFGIVGYDDRAGESD